MDRAAIARSTPGTRTRERATEVDEAEGIITRHYLPNRIEPVRGATVDMDLVGTRIGNVTASRLGFGEEVRLVTEEAHSFHVNMPVSGHAVSRSGGSDALCAGAGEGVVFSPEAPADITWSSDCVQLCVMVPRAALETELERLLGRSVRRRLRFDFGAGHTPGGGQVRTVLDLVTREIDHPSGLATHEAAARHLEGLVLDSLILERRHNYTDAAFGHHRTGPAGVIRRAVELLEDRPGEPWTTVGLATELHLSVRALQSGFRRELGTTPTAYLRLVRLRRAHATLRRADPADTTVQTVALGLGLLHLGRFAADYQLLFGEMPSETLRRHA